ncbi:Hsp20/alpha crystallin family protein [Rufibacter roseus]|uniref:Hsp20/alpha crystallin family protein n=1 Tax=Rufibacter roseus TaxID=1567108 RepID=A0ABW2DJN6_9BACT|nr:Hsp20/alpha crystallin family protein [Rufibacter roseus]
MAIQRFRSGLDDFMPQTFSSMLDRFFQDTVNSQERLSKFNPMVDSYETEKGFEIEVALPGLSKEDIQLDFQEGRLTISGERRFRKEEKEKRYHLIESQYGTFSRTFYLPDTVDADKIEAVFENGILHVSVPKDERKTARHRIEVRDGDTRSLAIESNGNSEKQAEAKQKNNAAAPKKRQLVHENGTH